jgi:hypothetical protein
MHKKIIIAFGLIAHFSYAGNYGGTPYYGYGNGYTYRNDDPRVFYDEQRKQQEALQDQMQKQQQHAIKKQLVATYKNSFDKKFQVFFSMINQAAKTFSQAKMASILDYINSKYGQSFLYKILINLDSATATPFLKVYFPDGTIPEYNASLEIDKDFYKDLLINIKSSFSDDDYNTFKGFAKDALKDKWEKIAKAIGDDDANNQDDNAQNKQDNSVWGANTNTGDFPELTTLLKKKNVSMPEIYFQFLKDFTKAFYTQTQTMQDSSSLLLTTTAPKWDYQDLSDKLHNFVIQYQSILMKKNVNADFLKTVGGIVKSTLKSVYPQTTAVMYKLYLSQIEKETKLKNKIDNGFRVDIQKSLSDYQIAQDKRSIKWDTDVITFMCIQTLGMLEAGFIQPENTPLSREDFSAKIKAKLDELANGLDHNGNIDNIAQSVLSGAVAKYQPVDQNILFGLMIYQLIPSFKFTPQQQNDVVSAIQIILTGNNVSLETIKASVQAFNQNKQQNQTFVKALTQVNSSKLLEPLKTKKDQQQSDDQKQPLSSSQGAKSLDASVQTVLTNALGNLFKS